MTVCPLCYFSALPSDFAALPEANIKRAETNGDERRESVSLIFPSLDFTGPRTLREGIASYYFAVMCYDFYDKKANPTFKAGLASLRAAWLLGDLHAAEPGENWDHLARVFYRKALFYYQLALEKESAGQEAFDASLAFGPDLDKNYGYYGVIYLAAYLEYEYGIKSDPEKRAGNLEYARRMMAKIFGVGKSSKNRPSAILDKAKEVYEQMGEEIRGSQARRRGADSADARAADRSHGRTKHQADPRLRRHRLPRLAAAEAGQDRPGRDAGRAGTDARSPGARPGCRDGPTPVSTRRARSANFSRDIDSIPPVRFRDAVNAYLPRDVRVVDSREVRPGFHARRSARLRVYRYYTVCGPVLLPHVRNFRHWVRRRLDLRLG